MKYNTMNNEEIIFSLCSRVKETRIALSMTQQQLADCAQVGIATIKRIEKGGGLNLDTLISILRAMNRLHNLDAILFESEMRNFNENNEGRQRKGGLHVRQETVDLNNKRRTAVAYGENSYCTSVESALFWG